MSAAVADAGRTPPDSAERIDEDAGDQNRQRRPYENSPDDFMKLSTVIRNE
jgi:hypothetical protein